MVDPARNSPEPWTVKRARVAGLARRHASPERIDEARADLAEARLADHIRHVVDGAPPLSAAQRERLALLLHPGSAGSAA